MPESPQSRAATAHPTKGATDAPRERRTGVERAAAQSAARGAQRNSARRPAASQTPSQTPPRAPTAQPLAETLRAGHAQLAERLAALQRALDQALSPEASVAARRATQQARAEAQRASDLLDTLTRLVALPETPLRLGQVEVSDLLIGALSRWKTRAPERTFELALPGNEPTLLGDGALIAQAIEGLIAWAVAHAGLGDIRVSLWPARSSTSDADEADEADEAAGAVTISLRAPLMVAPADDLPQRLFTRVAAPQPDGGGAVELALAQAIAARHAGRAWAEVRAGEQALTLALTLPSAPQAAQRGDATPPRDPEGVDAASDDGDGNELGAAPALLRARSVVVVAHGDARMARYLRANLEAAGYRAHATTALEAALQVIALEEPDLVLLDLTLPGHADGRAEGERRDPLARALGRVTAPIIALGPSDDPAACVAALDAGASDFIAQPLSVEETLARVRRALRPLPGAEPEARQRVYTCGDLVIDDTQRSVTIAGAPTGLSRTEYRLLRALAQNPGKTLSHETLLARVWGPAYSHEIEFVWVYIRRLRRKIEPDPAHPRYILTAPGVGYRLAQVAPGHAPSP